MNALKLISVLVLSVFALGCQQGKDGAPGAAGKVVMSIYCEDVVSSGPLAGIKITYNAVLMSAGDLFATGTVWAEWDQVSGTSFYAAGENGAQTGAVYITSDQDGADNEGRWKITVNRNTFVTTVQYSDASLGTASANFPASSCDVSTW